MKKLKNIFAGIMVALGVILCVVPGACLGATNLPMADVGDHGDWMTTENPLAFSNLPNDAATIPLPRDETTPPVTNINFVAIFYPNLSKLILSLIKVKKPRGYSSKLSYIF